MAGRASDKHDRSEGASTGRDKHPRYAASRVVWHYIRVVYIVGRIPAGASDRVQTIRTFETAVRAY